MGLHHSTTTAYCIYGATFVCQELFTELESCQLFLTPAEISLLLEPFLAKGASMGRYAASEIGRQLRGAREGRGLSVAEAARVMEVSREMLYKYEHGKSLPSLEILSKAARAWNTPFRLAGCEVIPEQGKKAKPPQPVQQFLPFRITRQYKKASVEIRRRDHEMIITAVIRNGA